MAFSTGYKLGPYEVLEPIGAGGMGEVYKARDTRLDRTVAIKISAKEFGERFQREAQAIAMPGNTVGSETKYWVRSTFDSEVPAALHNASA